MTSKRELELWVGRYMGQTTIREGSTAVRTGLIGDLQLTTDETTQLLTFFQSCNDLGVDAFARMSWGPALPSIPSMNESGA